MLFSIGIEVKSQYCCLKFFSDKLTNQSVFLKVLILHLQGCAQLSKTKVLH